MEEPTHKVLFVLPDPSTSILRGPDLLRKPGVYNKSPAMLIVAYIVREPTGAVMQELHFIEPVANAVYALFAVPEFASAAYDRVVEFPDSDWLLEVRARVASRPSGMDPSRLRHLAVMFDDGPFYDFICRGFDHIRKVVDSKSGELRASSGEVDG